jgi:hypothetical protein
VTDGLHQFLGIVPFTIGQEGCELFELGHGSRDMDWETDGDSRRGNCIMNHMNNFVN